MTFGFSKSPFLAHFQAILKLKVIIWFHFETYIELFHGSKLDQIYLCSIDKSWEKGDFENPKVVNRNFSTKSVPD